MCRTLLLAAFLASGAVAFADVACVPGTLNDYLALSPGCTIGGVSFQYFTLGPVPGFTTTVIDENLVAVTPVSNAGRSSLLLTLNSAAGPGEVLDLSFGFHIPTAEQGVEIKLGNPIASGDAAVTGILDVCLDSDFFFPGFCFSGPEKFAVAAVTDLDVLLSDVVQTSGASFFDVFVDLTIDGGLSGSASLQSAEITVITPEPSAVLLLMTALSAALGLQIRRRRL